MSTQFASIKAYFPTLLRIVTFPFRRWRVIAILVIVFVILLTIADQVLLRKLSEQRKAFVASGHGASLADIVPELHSSENAAIPYLHASVLINRAYQDLGHGLLRETFRDAHTCPLRRRDDREYKALTQDEIAFVAQHMKAVAPALEMVKEARALKGCQFSDFHAVKRSLAATGSSLPDFAQVRALSRDIAYRAVWEGTQGNVEEAIVWVTAGMRLANDLTAHPTTMAQLIRIAIAANALQALQDILSENELPDSLPPEFFEELAGLRNRKNLATFFKGERCYGDALYTNMSLVANPLSRTLTIRPSQLKQNELLSQLADAVLEEDYEKRKILLTPIDEFASSAAKMSTIRALLNPFHLMVKVCMPAYARISSACDRGIAEADLCGMAIALKKYKGMHGGYPDALTSLVPVFLETLPQDPFCGEPYCYRREGDGFLLYSVGDNGVDDGGLPLQGGKGGLTGDVLWGTLK
jgi:hypothetical protein